MSRKRLAIAISIALAIILVSSIWIWVLWAVIGMLALMGFLIIALICVIAGTVVWIQETDWTFRRSLAYIWDEFLR